MEDGATVTVDPLLPERVVGRSVFAFTHVAEIRFQNTQRVDQFGELASILFRTLSLMRGRWVGVAGPWLYVDTSICLISPQVTKTTPNGPCTNWCHRTVLGVFEELFPCLQTAYRDGAKASALQTGLHFLIESEQCAGGVEGAIVLQQAALEALAWFEIVEKRKLCSAGGFEVLPASDKIRWLASLFSIPTAIPVHCTELTAYAKAFQNIDDVPGVLVDIRNAIVHGTPKKVKRVFGRVRGEDERTELWYLSGGLLELAVLAVAGYHGKIVRRDVDVNLAISAIKDAPWT